ncbi:histidine kinase [Anaerococcus sp. AGMB09787]|uniref:histidine kinase n=1 Tax=Anaerococcus sp. AGMB09787 TaxID=2922869 RepID=UPI001FAF295F|nr:histidine kinase [Anaerococcus sp. AGMB09787]
MGLIFNNSNEIEEKVKSILGNTKDYLIVLKHNDLKKGLGKLLASNLLYTFDSNRSFLIFFDEKGIHEKEISNSLKGDFVLMPWHEIEDFELSEKSNKAILSFSHLGKKVAYEVSFSGKLFKNNRENLDNLKNKDWRRIS